MCLQLINNNAYRLLGVVANVSKKDIERNKSKFNAFLRVNRPVPTQPLDFPKLLLEVHRDLDSISKAESEISIPMGKLKHGMFWFVGMSKVDEDCFKSLTTGDAETAVEKWKKDGTVSSLQNILVCLLIKRQYREAILLAHNIYTLHFDEWRELYSLFSDVTSVEVSHIFLDNIYSEILKEIISMSWNGLPTEWETYIKQKSVTPISDHITSLIEKCKKANGDNPQLRYKDAFGLLEKALPLLNELESLLKPDDITLLSIEDKVYSLALTFIVESYCAVQDDLKNGNDKSYRQIAPLCNDLINKISMNYVSHTVSKRIADNRKVINEECENIDKTVEDYIAFNDKLCWFCGANGGTHELKKSYTYTTSNGITKTTYTKTVTIHICDDCQKELDERNKWEICCALIVFTIIAAIVLIFFDFWTDMELWGWFWTILVSIVLSAIGGGLLGPFLRRGIDKDNIREFKREIDDHPLVKMVKSEGYS